MWSVRRRVRAHFGVGRRAPWTRDMEEMAKVLLGDARRVGLPNVVIPPPGQAGSPAGGLPSGMHQSGAGWLIRMYI